MIEIEIIGIAIVTTLACVLPGVFLVLRGVALMSDAIAHSTLLGIVGVFFLVHQLESPLFILGASLMGVLTVSLTEWLINSKRVKKDAAIGLVFPLFFAIAVILISKYASHIHLNSDAVLFGEIAFAPFDRVILNGSDFGPKALWLMGGILGFNSLMIGLFYKELKVSTFDAGLATSLGISPTIMHYGLMSLTSITAVGAFDSVGSILVVALMITPPATAYLITNSLSGMVMMSCFIGVMAAMVGVFVSLYMDISIAGSIATVTGIFFMLGLIFAPRRGLLTRLLVVKKQRISFSLRLLLVQLLAHEGKASELIENTVANIINHMRWSNKLAQHVVRLGVSKDWLRHQNGRLFLTSLGREVAKREMVRF
tara:strand:- start:318 stop:1424 length:1107 start_codon:yes stop_codon:yes gene_type:complete